MVFPWFSHGFPMVMARYPQIIVIVMAVWEWFPLQVASFQWPISDVRSLKFDPWHPCLQNRGLANMWQGWGFTSSLATLSLWDLVCLKLQYQTRKHEMIPHFAQFKKSFITANLRCSVKKTVGEFIHIPIYSKTQGNQTGQGESRSTRSNLSFCSC